jgi:hypothetical protein
MRDDDPTPASTIVNTWRWTPAGCLWTLLALAFIVVVIGFLTHFGFWLDTQNVKHQGQVGAIRASQDYNNTIHSKAFQDAQISQMTQHLANIEGAGGLAASRASLPAGSPEQQVIRAQELGELRGFCSEAANVTPDNPALGGAGVPGAPTLRQLVAANCIAGSVAANPPLAMNPIPDNGA